MKEIWKDIQGYEGLYQVSNSGKVKSLRKNIIIKGNINKYGYHQILLQSNGKRKNKTVHRLVAETFLNNNSNKPQVNHKDGNKKNNFILNLEWCTKKENGHHASINKLYKSAKGEKHGNNKLKETQIIEIKKMLKFKSQNEIANIFNVAQTTISAIARNIIWGWLK